MCAKLMDTLSSLEVRRSKLGPAAPIIGAAHAAFDQIG